MVTPARPRIAVLIPAYNAEKTLARALDSLRADPEPHDIVIVDDGSRVPVETWVSPAPNLVVLRASQNGGVTRARNLGLAHILSLPYDFMACLDADDVSLDGRLGALRQFMDENPDVGFAGGWGRFVSEKGEPLYHFNPPQAHDKIVEKLFYNFCFVHSSMMFRAALLRQAGPYEEAYPSAEDYEFIRRLAARAKGANLPRYLVEYTVCTSGISLSKRREQLFSRLRIQWTYRDWTTPHFYLGMAKTLALGLVPYGLVMVLKRRIRAYRER